jgi:O-antigen ligase
VTTRYPTHALPVPFAAGSYSPATAAYVAFLAFMVVVYSNIALWFPALEAVAPGKTVIAFAAVALAFSCALSRREFTFGLGAGGLAVYLFAAMVLVSPVFSRWPEVSIDTVLESVKFFAGFVVAANVLDTRRRIRHAVAALVLVSLIPAIGATANYLAGVGLVEGTRASWIGVFGNPNFLAYHLVIAIPLALSLRDAAKPGENRVFVRLFWLGVVGLLCAGILLTGSRGGALGAGAVLLLWVTRSLVRGRIAIGAAAAVVIALLMTPASPFNREATRSALTGEIDESAQGRIDAWRTAERMVYHNPLVGVGAGAFVDSFDDYAPGDAGRARATHNSFVMIAAELGIPALLVFSAAIGASLLAMGRVARRGRRRIGTLAPVARGVQVAIFGFAVCSLTGGYAFTWPLYFILGIAAAIHRRAEALAPK